MSIRQSLALFVRNNAQEILFFALFGAFFVLLQFFYYVAHLFTDTYILHRVNAQVAAWFVQLFTPGHHAVADGALLTTRLATLRIAQGCDGVDGILLLVAALLAYPAGLWRKLAGVFLGTLFLYCVNMVRILGLYYAYIRKPELFDFLHTYAGQAFFILLTFVFFLLWIGTGRHATQGHAKDA